MVSVTSQSLWGDLNPFLTISQEEFLKGGKELDQKMVEACALGFFYLEIPLDCKPLIDRAVQFAHTFYKDETITQLKLPNFAGFSKRPWQAESLFLEPQDWKIYLPEDVVKLSQKMHELSIQILKIVLRVCEVPEKDWSEGTGGVTDNKEWIHFSAHHYRPEIEGIGMEEHKDMGQVAVLFIDQEGLEMKKEHQWIPVPHKKDCFVINFGRALETFVNRKQCLVAAEHRVTHVSDRASFGLFSDNGPDTYLYQRSLTGELVRKETYMEYIHKLLAKTLN